MNNNVETQLDEQYYKQYLLFNIDNSYAWMSYIRIQCKKAFMYFDSLVGVQPIDCYKNKFLYTKRVINFVKLNVTNSGEVDNSNKMVIEENVSIMQQGLIQKELQSKDNQNI